MRLLIAVLCAMLAFATGRSINYYAGTPIGPRGYPHSYSLHSSSLVTPTQQQYHTQDELGQYAYGYSEPLSSKQEVRSLDGVTRGSYSYRDAKGKLQMVYYTADENGFRVAATNLPRSVSTPAKPAPTVAADTAGVAAARATHHAALFDAGLRLAKPDTAAHQLGPVDAVRGDMELRYTVDNTIAAYTAGATAIRTVPADTIAVAANRVTAATEPQLSRKAIQLKAFTGRSEVSAPPAIIGTTLPVAYQVHAVIPSIYGYNYPLKSHFLATNLHY